MADGYRDLTDEELAQFKAGAASTATAPGMSLSPAASADNAGGYRPFDPAKDRMRPEDAPQLPQGYTSTYAPFSYDPQGRRSWDANAGVLGMLQRALTLPSDVVSGNIPAIGPDARVNPELIRRSVELGGLMASPNPAVVAGDRAFPGALMAGQRPVPVPTVPELRTAGGQGIKDVIASGLEVNPTSLEQAATGVRQQLLAERHLRETAPQTHAQLDALEGTKPADIGGLAPGDIGVLQSTHSQLSKLTMSNNPQEAAAAALALRRLDPLLQNLTPEHIVGGTMSGPEAAAALQGARANYGAGERARDLSGVGDRANTGIIESAETRAAATHSGQNVDNMIRQRVASFLQSPSNLAGFSDAEIAALNDVARGGPVQNLLRVGSNFLNRPGMQAVGAGIGAAVDPFGGPAGAAIGSTVPAMGGGLLRMIENALAKRSLSAVDEAVRMRSPLYEQRMAAPQAITPQYRATMETMRGLLPMLMAPPPPGVRPWSPADQGFI